MLAIWLPSLALVIAWDYEGTLGRVVVPALQRSLASVLHRLAWGAEGATGVGARSVLLTTVAQATP
jgi:hypothetical protein